ncbi:tetratricopeptide repeat protein [Azospirillum sp.]|uniref:O-linked N-acetylglucosamine transferase, SPINDLY family protein n=1 Tax=Azospirillum sp. TaxID=34012 RepID=UPI002D287B20|nr:tetratricopeptide repeat protein [Azospirillum sp.]HYD67760.1 tetratricopeptide repeat protein [Azospirillum sp.]
MTDAAGLLAAADADRRAGRLDAAVAGYRRVLALAPGQGMALAGLFAALDALDRPGAPEEAVARSNRAEALRRQGQLDLAEAEHRAALAWLPDFGGVRFNYAVLLHARGRTAEAAEQYRAAVRLMPAFAPAHSNLGAVLKELGRHGEALGALREAVRLAPDLLAAWLNLGAVLKELGDPAGAATGFRAALALNPALAEAHANLGQLCREAGDPPAAAAAFERALAIGLPDAGGVLAQLVQQRRHLCRWDGLSALSARLVRAVADGTTQQAHPWIFLGEGAGPAAELTCARRYTAWRTRSVTPLPPLPPGAAKPRLRIGYLSADYHEHATALLIAELIERHDRARVEVVGYSYGPDDGGALRARLRRGFDRFVDLALEPHAAAARRIRADGVDILVDLKGHTQGARPEIPAFRPAPVQAHWLGYPGSMGADFIDYVIADAVTAPAALQPHVAERIVRLPGCYQPNDRTRLIAGTPSRAACGLPAQGFVFCCFNAAYKINAAIYAVWMRLLTAVPGSVLWLLEGHPEAAANLRCEAAARGVDPARLVFSPRLPPAEYLARCRLADLFLDTLPVGAHTTASDALWAGLPVLTVRGDAFAGRVGASLLRAVGLPELAVESLDAYEAAALRLAADPAALAAIKERLAAGRESAILWDTDRLARDLERAYAALWAIHAAGEPPRAIDVPDA